MLKEHVLSWKPGHKGEVKIGKSKQGGENSRRNAGCSDVF